MINGLKFVVCVDWEGLSLENDNLNGLIEFKKRWAIPMVHYMNPAYFTHKSLKNTAKSVDFRTIIQSSDEWGLHLHAPRHLIEKAGLGFRDSPTFSTSGDDNEGDFKGHEVMLHAYSNQELSQLIEYSLEVFKSQDFPKPQSFRAGGWMLDTSQYSELLKWGFEMDSSMAPASSLKGSCWERDNLQRYLSILWTNIDEFSQPEFNDGIFQIPNNLGAIDYWKESELETFANQVLSRGQEESFTATITLHQETAAQYLPLLNQFLEIIFASKIDCDFYTNKELFNLSQSQWQLPSSETTLHLSS